MNTKTHLPQLCKGRSARLALAVIFTFSLFLWMGPAAQVEAGTRTDIPGPSGSAAFGKVTVLPNGNFVVVDKGYDIPAPPVTDVGAVYLYSGSGTLISTLTGSRAGDQVGSGGIFVLANGKYVVSSPDWDNGTTSNAGAATLCTDAAGLNGIVSASNSLIGPANTRTSSAGLMPLSSGNYVVNSPDWNNLRGAATWVNGATGLIETISASNSLVGATSMDFVGSGVMPLENGNYLVFSPTWDLGLLSEVGAVTWGSGLAGVKGVVSASNSLTGSSAGDMIGFPIPLSNGNYVVMSHSWNNNLASDAGAATWGNGLTGITGSVSASNSLVGSQTMDLVGSVVPLQDGNYLVLSPDLNGGAYKLGAVTWGNGANGSVKGSITVANSLVGSSNGDRVGSGGALVLPNGSVVVASPEWHNVSVAAAGAVTWVSSKAGLTGPVTTVNSLVGSHANDRVGGEGVLDLGNGNYVVVSPLWDNAGVTDAGAVTWGNGATGVMGTISAVNSLVGSSSSDQIGTQSGGEVTVLTNGNYVVASPYWDNTGAVDAGAVTWGSGIAGVHGAISSANSLVGAHAGDQTGLYGVTALTNGNYVARIPYWDNVAVNDVGAVTWGNGASGVIGVVSASNSLVGSHTGDQVGVFGVTAIANGNYVVVSLNWAHGGAASAGAVTWMDGAVASAGVVSTANSLVGSQFGDSVGNVTPLPDGNYMVASPSWNNEGTADVGAVTVINGMAACAPEEKVGEINSSNAVIGVASGAGSTMEFSYDAFHHRLVVGRPSDNAVSLYTPVDCYKYVYLPMLRK